MEPSQFKSAVSVSIILNCTLFTLLFFSKNARAQSADSITINKNSWIETMTDVVNYKLTITNDLETFSVKAGNFNPKFFPNTSTTLKINLNYKFLSFSFKQAPSFIPGNHDNEKKGKTRNFGISFDFIHPHWFTTFNYSKNKGYYIYNSNEISNTWQSGDAYLQLPNMKVNSFQGLIGYSFNENFSIRSITTQTERQIKSAGSFVPIFSYRLYYVNNLSDNSGQGSRNFESILGAGYRYTLVMKKSFYASLGLTPGLGYIFTKLTTRGQLGSPNVIITNNKAPIARIEGRGALGYNGKKFFAGVLLEVFNTSYEQENTTVVNTNTHTFYQVFVGFRTPAPKSLKNTMNKVPVK